MPTLQFDKSSPLHAFLLERVRNRYNLGKRGQQKFHDRWIRAENTCLAYMHETEVDNARRSARNWGQPKYTTIMIPYTYGMLMSAHTYWTSVFLSRSPIHQIQGRHGEAEMQVQAVEALLDYQTTVGQNIQPYYIWIYDSGKYGFGVLGNFWTKEVSQYGQLVQMDDPANPGQTALYQTTSEVELYQGSKCYNVSPWDFFPDPRVSIKKFQDGEFCCRRFELGWHQLIRRAKDGYYNQNIKYLKGHVDSRKMRDAQSALELPEFNLTSIASLENESKHATGGSFIEVYVNLIPNEWRLGSTGMPQKWCFTVSEDMEVIIGATPIGYAHCQFPFDILESEIEGYGASVRGIPEIMEGIQNTVDWLINTHFFNVRASLNNQFIVDPSKLVIRDIQNTGPGFLWRLRPEAYGTDISKMFAQVPVQDVTRSHIADFQTMLGIGERTLGINDQIMGALNTGSSRKTATEVRTTTGFGTNRMKTICEYMSAAGFSPHSMKMVQNSQQFYDAEQKFRRVGNLAVDAGEKFMTISPQDIAGYYDFVNVDGTLPIDRMAQVNLWKEIMQNAQQMPPQISQGYDWGRIFAWTAQLGGLKNITNFRIQMMPQQQLEQGVQSGNVVQMPARPGLPALPGRPSGGGAPNSATESGLNALGAGHG